MFEKLEGAQRQKSWLDKLIATVGAMLYAPTAPTPNKKNLRQEVPS